MSSLGEAHPDFARKVDAKAIYRKVTSSEQCFGFEHAPQESLLRKALDSPWLIVVVWFVADRLAVHWLRIATLIPWLILIGQRHLVCGRTWCAIGKHKGERLCSECQKHESNNQLKAQHVFRCDATSKEAAVMVEA